jgi:hypothetical protein
LQFRYRGSRRRSAVAQLFSLGINATSNLKDKNMDKITRYEWHGSWLILLLLFFLGITIPVAVVYFMTNLLKIETQVADSTKLSEFLESRK